LLTLTDKILDLVERYSPVRWHTCGGGLIVWRRGTGDNVELLYIRAGAREARVGSGRALLRAMLAKLADEPPYSSVFGFTRTSNLEAQAFYRRMGFELSPVTGVYADGDAVLFSQTYEELKKKHLLGKE
jgi:ribosomal protein S18 acetylase RimI-like enzyme